MTNVADFARPERNHDQTPISRNIALRLTHCPASIAEVQSCCGPNQLTGEHHHAVHVQNSFPVEAGNAAAKKEGFKAIESILGQQKPEAAYLAAENGKRTGILVINMQDASEIPAIAEPGSWR
jgi:hypothetical protein